MVEVYRDVTETGPRGKEQDEVIAAAVLYRWWVELHRKWPSFIIMKNETDIWNQFAMKPRG